MDAESRNQRKQRFGRSLVQPESFDIVLNADIPTPPDGGDPRAAVAARGLVEHGLLSAAGEAQLQFQTRLHLAKHKIVPAGRASVKRIVFGHPSEEIFANLLDFYRIHWSTSRAASRFNGTRTATSWKRSHPISTCRNLISMSSSPP